jgi:putative flavoprotein involved in K+ transport
MSAERTTGTRTTTTTTVVVGGGPAGLAMSACLGARGVDHVVLERGVVGRSWRTERWDSLRLLTPNWMSGLPGRRDPVPDPDGFMTAGEVVDALERHRRTLDLPVLEHTAVRSLRPTPFGYRVDTDRGPLRCVAVVVATGTNGAPRLPAVASTLPTHVRQLPALRYRNPDQIGPGGVLVVGASASGVQIADELRRAGRDVTIAAGEHVCLPRRYRGRDIYWWMHAMGMLDEGVAPHDLERVRRLPSAQLVGSPDRRSIDLGSLSAGGVTVVGRLAGIDARRLQFSGGLSHLVTAAMLKRDRLLQRIDDHVATVGLAGDVGSVDRPGPVELPDPETELDIARFETVIWATGHRQHHPWLPTSLLDRWGRIRHDGGVMDASGLYVLGHPFLRRRSSGLLAGIGVDAGELADRLLADLGRATAA